jgi:hypothetical protein
MNVLYRINEDFSLCILPVTFNKEIINHVLITYQNDKLFYILGGFENLLERIKKYPEDTDYIINHLHGVEHINFLNGYCKLTMYCINNLNFSEDNFQVDFAKFIIKVLQNLIFQ